MQLDNFKSELSFSHKLLRLTWGIVWMLLFRPSPRPCHVWRRWLLIAFGAKIGKRAKVYQSAKVYYPPNLYLGDYSVIGPDVDVYCVAPIRIGPNSIISQYSYLCAATHDYTQAHFPLVAQPIEVGEGSWLCARCFIGPGVRVGSHCVVAACAVAVKNIPDNSVVGGNPAKQLKTTSKSSIVP